MGKTRGEVRSDRFHLQDRRLYILDGTLEAGSTIRAFLDSEELPVRTETVESFSAMDRFRDQEREGGTIQIRVTVTLPDSLRKTRYLTIYSCAENRRLLWFRISSRRLKLRRSQPQFFLEEEAVSRENVRLRGWAVDEVEVRIRLTSLSGTVLPAEIQRTMREDVARMFPEGNAGGKTGFYIEADRPKGRTLLLILEGKAGNVVYPVRLSKPAVFLAKGMKYAGKGWSALKTGGIQGLWEKTRKKLYLRSIREIPYEDWLPRHLPSAGELERQKKAKFSYRPYFSVVVPLYRTPRTFLMQLADSVLAQTYPDWELILCDGSGEPSPVIGTARELSGRDSRIRVISSMHPLGISGNTNAGIDEARGDYLVFVDHDDLLEPHALYEAASWLNLPLKNKNGRYRILYSDEDKVTMDGHKYFQPHFKPDYNEHLLCSVNYICHLLIMERELVLKTGKLRPGFDGAQDHDLILRAVEQVSREEIGHIPRILYHWRAHESSTALKPDSKNYAFAAGKRAIEEHYHRRGLRAEVTEGEYAGLYKTKLVWEEKPLISILIPNKDHIEDLRQCIASIEEQDYKHYEYVIIENNSEEEETFRYYEELQEKNKKARVVRWEGSFNFSAINNFGEKYARGDYLLLLNNDTKMITPDCLYQLLMYCMEPEVGAAGALLYYEDDTIQHAGVVIGFGGIAGHCFVLQPRGSSGYMHRIICTQEYSAVTAACMMVKRKAFHEVGGLSEDLAVAFNDIDFCLKLRKAGYLIVYNPCAQLYHFESKSRGLEDNPEKVERFQKEIGIFEKRWPRILKEGDPYYNPNLTLESQDFSRRRL